MSDKQIGNLAVLVWITVIGLGFYAIFGTDIVPVNLTQVQHIKGQVKR